MAIASLSTMTAGSEISRPNLVPFFRAAAMLVLTRSKILNRAGNRNRNPKCHLPRNTESRSRWDRLSCHL